MPHDHETILDAPDQLLERLELAEREIDRLQRELNHLQRLATLGTIAAGAAHEINNILTPVLNYAQMASTRPEDGELVAKAIERAAAGADHATRLAQSMLDFAAPDDADASAEVGEVVAASFDCLGRDPARAGIDIRVDVPRGTRVAIGPLALQQIMVNLIMNAITAMMQVRRRQLTISACPQSDGIVRIRVSDTGPGIPADLMPRLFKPFAAAKGDTDHASKEERPGKGGQTGECDRPTRGGSGLGLAVCRRLAEAANGSIHFDSSDDTGATFTLLLPSSPATCHAKAG